MSAESPRPEIQVVEKTKPDPEAAEREQRRKRAEQIDANLRLAIDEGIARRVGPVKRIQRAA